MDFGGVDDTRLDDAGSLYRGPCEVLQEAIVAHACRVILAVRYLLDQKASTQAAPPTSVNDTLPSPSPWRSDPSYQSLRAASSSAGFTSVAQVKECLRTAPRYSLLTAVHLLRCPLAPHRRGRIGRDAAPSRRALLQAVDAVLGDGEQEEGPHACIGHREPSSSGDEFRTQAVLLLTEWLLKDRGESATLVKHALDTATVGHSRPHATGSYWLHNGTDDLEEDAEREVSLLVIASPTTRGRRVVQRGSLLLQVFPELCHTRDASIVGDAEQQQNQRAADTTDDEEQHRSIACGCTHRWFQADLPCWLLQGALLEHATVWSSSSLLKRAFDGWCARRGLRVLARMAAADAAAAAETDAKRVRSLRTPTGRPRSENAAGSPVSVRAPAQHAGRHRRLSPPTADRETKGPGSSPATSDSSHGEWIDRSPHLPAPSGVLPVETHRAARHASAPESNDGRRMRAPAPSLQSAQTEGIENASSILDGSVHSLPSEPAVSRQARKESSLAPAESAGVALREGTSSSTSRLDTVLAGTTAVMVAASSPWPPAGDAVAETSAPVVKELFGISQAQTPPSPTAVERDGHAHTAEHECSHAAAVPLPEGLLATVHSSRIARLEWDEDDEESLMSALSQMRQRMRAKLFYRWRDEKLFQALAVRYTRARRRESTLRDAVARWRARVRQRERKRLSGIHDSLCETFTQQKSARRVHVAFHHWQEETHARQFAFATYGARVFAHWRRLSLASRFVRHTPAHVFNSTTAAHRTGDGEVKGEHQQLVAWLPSLPVRAQQADVAQAHFYRWRERYQSRRADRFLSCQRQRRMLRSMRDAAQQHQRVRTVSARLRQQELHVCFTIWRRVFDESHVLRRLLRDDEVRVTGAAFTRWKARTASARSSLEKAVEWEETCERRRLARYLQWWHQRATWRSQLQRYARSHEPLQLHSAWSRWRQRVRSIEDFRNDRNGLADAVYARELSRRAVRRLRAVVRARQDAQLHRHHAALWQQATALHEQRLCARVFLHWRTSAYLLSTTGTDSRRRVPRAALVREAMELRAAHRLQQQQQARSTWPRSPTDARDGPPPPPSGVPFPHRLVAPMGTATALSAADEPDGLHAPPTGSAANPHAATPQPRAYSSSNGRRKRTSHDPRPLASDPNVLRDDDPSRRRDPIPRSGAGPSPTALVEPTLRTAKHSDGRTVNQREKERRPHSHHHQQQQSLPPFSMLSSSPLSTDDGSIDSNSNDAAHSRRVGPVAHGRHTPAPTVGCHARTKLAAERALVLFQTSRKTSGLGKEAPVDRRAAPLHAKTSRLFLTSRAVLPVAAADAASNDARRALRSRTASPSTSLASSSNSSSERMCTTPDPRVLRGTAAATEVSSTPALSRSATCSSAAPPSTVQAGDRSSVAPLPSPRRRADSRQPPAPRPPSSRWPAGLNNSHEVEEIASATPPPSRTPPRERRVTRRAAGAKPAWRPL